MDYHYHARLTMHGREQMCSSVVEGRVIEQRRGHRAGWRIARETGLSTATVSRILRRAGISRWRDLHPPAPIVRYEHPCPGDLLHLDIKGMTRFTEVSQRGDRRLRGKRKHPGFCALHSSPGPTSTTWNDPMLASTKDRQTAGSSCQQPLDRLHLPQHKTFFTLDPDCIPVTPDLPWPMSRQWLQAVANSGTVLLVSVDSRAMGKGQLDAMREAFALCAHKSNSQLLNWAESRTPSAWRSSGGTETYNWILEEGESPFPIGIPRGPD